MYQVKVDEAKNLPQKIQSWQFSIPSNIPLTFLNGSEEWFYMFVLHVVFYLVECCVQ